MDKWPKRTGETVGWHWALKRGERRRATYGRLDTNHWKTFLCERIAAALGETGSLTVFGDRPESHRMLLDHLTAETCIQTSGHERKLWEWRASGQDNHWLDCLQMNCAAASMIGCVLANTTALLPDDDRRTVSRPAKMTKGVRING